MSVLVEFKHVSFRYSPEDPVLLSDVSLGFTGNKVTVILGPNGAGKTTLLKLILGWLRPQSGSILIETRDVKDFTGTERGQFMSLVPQSEHIPFEYSLLEYVLLGRIPYMKPLELPGDKNIQAAAEAIRKVGLDPSDPRPINILSGGERQLLLLARSLCQQPQLLILDEPTSHLDLANKKRLSGILNILRGQGLTIILTTHEPEFAVSIADDLVLMNRSGIIAHGGIDDTCTPELLGKTYGTEITTKRIDGKRIVFWS